MKIESDRAIILRRINYSEADRIVTFLTEKSGKIRTIVKGARKQKSKLAGGIELFSVSEIHYIKGRGAIDTLTSSRLERYYENIVKDLDKTNLAYAMLKQIDKRVEDHSGQEYFEIVNESLMSLNKNNIAVNLVRISFELRVLQVFGGLPDFSKDKNGKKLSPLGIYRFDSSNISFIESEDGRYSQNHLKVLRLLANNSPVLVSQVENIDKYIEELEEVLDAIIANQAY